MATKLRLGDLLVEGKLITESQLMGALDIQKQSGGKRLGSILVDLGIVSEEQMLEVLRKKLNTDFVRFEEFQVPEQILELIPENIAREKLLFPYKFQGNTLYVATSDPLDYDTLNEISTITGRAIEPVIATRADIEMGINKFYNKHSMDSIASTLNNSASANTDLESFTGINFDEIESRVGEVPVVKFINNLIAQAYSKRASDIHIEPLHEAIRIRLRIDGQMMEIVRMNSKALSSIVTRVKIMSGMDIAEKRIPLDGRFSVDIEDSTVSVRAASMPTLYGEKIVLRLMSDTKSGILPLESLGITSEQCQTIRKSIKVPNGLILVTGPTGSGKSTTLYSILNELSDDTTNVLTVEDPIEKAVPGVNQTQVNPKAGLTFATGLRAILRQDPDKIMIGEIRDSETADIAARAAITGHLVLASMHTNSAAAAYMRLVDMGIEPYIVASSMIAVIAQRLVRMVCPFCKEAYTPTENELKFLAEKGVTQVPELYKGRGCDRCDYTGNLGRTAVLEIVTTDTNLRDMIVRKAKSTDIDEYLQNVRKHRYMLDHGLDLVLQGKIGINELLSLSQSLEF